MRTGFRVMGWALLLLAIAGLPGLPALADDVPLPSWTGSARANDQCAEASPDGSVSVQPPNCVPQQ